MERAATATGRDGEWARHWHCPGVPGLDLLRACYVRHSFARHSHEGYVLGAVRRGIEDVRMPDGTISAVPGSVVMINPEVPHSARAGVPEGWSYATLYPSRDLVAEVAAEITTLRGTPGFAETIVEDQETSRLIHEVHRAAEEGNALAADSLVRIALARMLRLHGFSLPVRRSGAAAARTAAAAREILLERMDRPPPLEGLAYELGTDPFALLRAYKAAYGLPPHTWLTNARVQRARLLLDAGATPADAALAVGFSDQPHLNRHFTRIVGVPPGAYRRERARTYKTGGPPPS
ncbi:AraC family transcriptional regulator [Streptomyces candidus]|uniref:AraC-like DNA-binding protein n=1 Tax=Streptomyces candidus TaxID=67283 RepID=A0A7X0LN75_9ACTN|nr:AraC family transcriptional regulator [Streptomyces candidus]MBB6434189.1 AraC-like DNA-binding protein [Streptomyces candidus]GHH37620.1 AraC family transcriptional regulator [Streptomyces candidus]